MKCKLAFSYIIAASVMGCGASPVDRSDVGEDIQEYLNSDAPSEVSHDTAYALDRSQGYAQNLLAAVKRHQSYISAVALEQEAFSQIGVAQSLRKPQIGASANAIAAREVGGDSAISKGVAGGISLSQLIYDGGGSASVVNRATALAFVAQADRISLSNDLALSAARAWVDFWQYSERLRLLSMRTSEMSMLVEQIEKMAENGLLDRTSLDGARRQIVEIDLEEARLRNGQAEAAVFFERFFVSVPAELPHPEELVSSAQARAIAKDWRNAPLLQSQAAEVFAAKATVAEAQAAFLPRARVNVGGRSPTDESEPPELAVGLSLEYTWGDGGRRKAELESAQFRSDAAIAQFTDAQSALQSELEAMLIRLSAIETSVPLLQEKLRLSRSEAETSRSQLATGQSNLRELVEAEIEIYRAQDQQIAMHAERQILLLTIAARTGALTGLIGLQQ
jgi:adhesin transport system outer membrane protein